MTNLFADDLASGRAIVLDAFARPKGQFDFGVGFDFIYQISEQFHFVPSVEDLYWLELEVFDRDGVKDFIRRL